MVDLRDIKSADREELNKFIDGVVEKQNTVFDAKWIENQVQQTLVAGFLKFAGDLMPKVAKTLNLPDAKEGSIADVSSKLNKISSKAYEIKQADSEYYNQIIDTTSGIIRDDYTKNDFNRASMKNEEELNRFYEEYERNRGDVSNLDWEQSISLIMDSIKNNPELFKAFIKDLNNPELEQAVDVISTGEQKTIDDRAVYDKDGIKIEIPESLQPEFEENAVPEHGTGYDEAAYDVGDEETKVAQDLVDSRNDDDNTISLIVNNSQKISIKVEPYIEGDKDSQEAKETNQQNLDEQRKQAALEEQQLDDERQLGDKSSH